MRYYRIDIQKSDGTPYNFSTLGGLPLTSLLPDGTFNPAALNVEMDIPLAPYHLPLGNAWVRIWGLGVQYVGALNDLNGLNITISGGMSKGLPLANPTQQGVLVQGQIYQAFGNWVGIEQSTDLLLIPPTGTVAQPKNFIMSWRAGTPLSSALQAALSTALPSVPQSISVNGNLVLQHDEIGYYPTLEQFAYAVYRISKSIAPTANYQGVAISYDGTKIVASDGTTQPAAKTINFTDMIGQPTWIDTQTITVQLVMRGDLDLLDTITLPKTPFITAPSSLPGYNSNIKNQTTFSGNFTITAMRHIGNFRQPDAASWNTTIQAIPQQT